MKKKIRIVLAATALLILCLCAAIPALSEGVQYTKATLNYTKYTLTPGKQFQLSLKKFAPADANDGQWVSSNTDVCTVDETGLVKSMTGVTKTTTAKVSFVSGGKTLASCKVTVKIIAVSSVKLNKTSLAMALNKTYQLTAKISPSNAYCKDVTWSSSDPTVVKVEQDGTIIPLRMGTVTIKCVSNNGKKATCKVKVSDLRVTKVDITRTSLKMNPRQETTLEYTVKPLLATNTDLAWKSSNESIATVENGVVTAHGEGTCTITATALDGSNKKDSVRINVVAVRAEKVVFAEEYEQYLKKGDTFQAKVIVTPANTTFPEPTWTSSDESILTVDEDGNVKIKNNGICKLTCSVDGGRKTVSRTFYVTDQNPVTITVSVAGDTFIGGDPRNSSYTYATLSRFQALMRENNNDAGFVFKNVKSVFEKDDITILNLETVFTKRTTGYDTSLPHVIKGYPSYAKALSDNSVEVVSLENNKTSAWKQEGLKETKKAIDTYTAGKTKWVTADDPVLYEVKGVTVGIIGFQQNKSTKVIRARIEELRSQCDVLIVYYHWTKSNNTGHTTTASMKTYAHAAVDAGADLVLGAHQHYLCGIELYNGRPIVYGLGNFCTGGTADRDTMIFQQTFKVYDGFCDSSDYTVIPCCTTDDILHFNKWQPIILTDSAEKQALIDRLHSYSKNYDVPGI